MIIFLIFSTKSYIVTPRLNHLIEMLQLRGLNIFFMQNFQKLSLIITKYSLLSRALNVLWERPQNIVKKNSSFITMLLI